MESILERYEDTSTDATTMEKKEGQQVLEQQEEQEEQEEEEEVEQVEQEDKTPNLENKQDELLELKEKQEMEQQEEQEEDEDEVLKMQDAEKQIANLEQFFAEPDTIETFGETEIVQLKSVINDL